MSFELGKITFNRSQYQQKNGLISVPIMKQLMKSHHWKINRNTYKNDKWQQILPMIQKTQLEYLQIKATYQPLCLRLISNISFPALQELNLQVNQITNIEPLVKLNVPVLSKLVLSNNQITSIRPLAKMKLKYLRILDLDGNKISDFSPLLNASLSATMERINIDSWSQQHVQLNDYKWLIKIKPKSIKQLGILVEQDYDKIIRRSKFDDMLRRKYINVNIK